MGRGGAYWGGGQHLFGSEGGWIGGEGGFQPSLIQRPPPWLKGTQGRPFMNLKGFFFFFFYLKVLYFSFLILHVKYRQGPSTVPSGTPGGSTDPLFKALDMEN